MKSVLISINPKWVWKITRDEKTIEVRKTAPKEVPFKAYIYCSYGNDKENYMLGGCGKIIGEFICDKRDEYAYDYCDGVDIDDDTIIETAISREDINIYAKGKTLYGWHISDLKIYDKPKELSEFNRPCPSANHNCEPCITYGKPYTWDFDESAGKIFCTRRITRPPQSWQYVEELENGQETAD